MLKKGKVLALILAFSMLFASVAYAAIPNNSVVIGSKAYSIDYLMVEANIPEINQAVAENGTNPIFYQLPGVAESWTDVMTGQTATPEQIAAWPEITYKDANKNVTRYAPGDGDEIPANGQEPSAPGSVEAIEEIRAKLDDFFGQTYVWVFLNEGIEAASVTANGEALQYNAEDQKWEGVLDNLQVEDTVHVVVTTTAGASDEGSAIVVAMGDLK